MVMITSVFPFGLRTCVDAKSFLEGKSTCHETMCDFQLRKEQCLAANIAESPAEQLEIAWHEFQTAQ